MALNSKRCNINYKTKGLHPKSYCPFKWHTSIKLNYQTLTRPSGQIIVLHYLGCLYTPMLIQMQTSHAHPIHLHLLHELQNCGIN